MAEKKTKATVANKTAPKKSVAKKATPKKKDVGYKMEPPKVTAKKEQAKKTRKSKIDEKTEQLIIKDYKAGISYVEMASKYNSSRGSVYNVLVRNKIIVPQKRKTK